LRGGEHESGNRRVEVLVRSGDRCRVRDRREAAYYAVFQAGESSCRSTDSLMIVRVPAHRDGACQLRQGGVPGRTEGSWLRRSSRESHADAGSEFETLRLARLVEQPELPGALERSESWAARPKQSGFRVLPPDDRLGGVMANADRLMQESGKAHADGRGMGCGQRRWGRGCWREKEGGGEALIAPSSGRSSRITPVTARAR